MGIMIGSMSSLEPTRRKDITAVAFRALISGSCVTFMTASIAGVYSYHNDKIPFIDHKHVNFYKIVYRIINDARSI